MKGKKSKLVYIRWTPDKKFGTVPYQRALSKQHSNSIAKSIRAKGNKIAFSQPMVFNDRGRGKLMLLDGYHRHEALKKIGEPIILKAEVYNGLTIDEEKDLYLAYNIGKKHTSLDLIRPRIKEYPALVKLLKESPMQLQLHVNRKKGYSVINILQMYKYAIEISGLHKQTWGRVKIIDFIHTNFTERDTGMLLKYLHFHMQNFGDYNSKAWAYNKKFMIGMMAVYFGCTDLSKLQARLLRFKPDSYLMELMKYGGFGREANYYFTRALNLALSKRLRQPIAMISDLYASPIKVDETDENKIPDQ